MKLQTKIVVATLAIFIISLIFISILIFSNSRADLQNQVFNQLSSVSQITEKNVETFLEGQKNKIELVATQSALSNEELSQMVALDDSFYDMFVIDSSGMVVFSSNSDRLGLYRGDRDYFVNARNQTHIGSVYFALVPKLYSISVSTPFHDGVLVGSIKLETLGKLVQDKTGLGKTGETLMAFLDENDNLVYFGERRFSNNTWETIPSDMAKGRPIYRALKGQEDLIAGLKDYRGVETISATNYIDIIGIGMVTKIDTVEAFSNAESLKKVTFFIVLINLILVGFAMFIVSRPITRELQDVTQDIDKITKGDLDIQLGKSETFEIQSLVNSLNRILASMKLAILRVGVGKDALAIGDAVKAKEEVEEKYDIIFKNATDQIFIIDENYKYLAANDSTMQNLRKKPEEIIGKSVDEVVSKDVASQFSKNLKMVFQTGKPLFTEERIELPSKQIIWASTRLNPVKNSSGIVISVMGIIRDITDIKMVEEKYKSLYKSSSEAIMALEPPSWNFTMGNPATLKMFGARNEKEFLARTPDELSPKKQPDGKLSSEKSRKMIEKAMKEGSVEFDWTHRRINGEEFLARVRLDRIKEGDRAYLQATVHEIGKNRK